MRNRAANTQATHRVYSVIEREGQDDFWQNLGLAFAHKDGKGFNVRLRAFPVDGQLVCREFAPGEKPEARAGRREQRPSKQATKR